MSTAENYVICVSGRGSVAEFGCLITDAIPDLHLVSQAQTFPRWVYSKGEFFGEMTREDNITDHALNLFQAEYEDTSITKDDIFDYVYGILHAPDYRTRFAADLRVDLPRIPMADDFWAFADAGAALAHLHLNWHLDGNPNYYTDLDVLFESKKPRKNITHVEKMKWEERAEGRFIRYNDCFSVGPIPEQAMDYTICNRTPLDWVIDSYQIKTDAESGLVNDPNDWIKQQGRSDALIELIRRVTFLSIETAEIIKGLPPGLKFEINEFSTNRVAAQKPDNF